MKSRRIIALQLLGAFLAGLAGLQAAKVTPDLLPPQRRQTSVATAERIAHRTTPPPLPADLVSPFNPKDFDKVETQEAPRAATDPRTAVPAPPPPALGERQILEVLAAQLSPTGTMQIGGSPRLVMGSKRFEIGTRFTVTYNNEDYELELVTIERTTFTLRYRGEEITRPIKSVR